MGTKRRQNATDSPTVEVGEIDTTTPFQSVKDAVTLFGEGAFSGEELVIRKRVLAKETQLHLARKELNKLKDQVKNAEMTKGQTLVELEKATRTVENLTEKLRTVNELKDMANRETEFAKTQANQIQETKSSDTSRSSGNTKQDLESARQQYMTVFTELDAAKQELWKIRRECETSLEAKLAVFNQAAEAEQAAEANMEKVSELSKELSVLQESIGQVKLASLLTQQEQAKIFAEKHFLKQSYQATLEASANKLLALKNEFDPEVVLNLEKQLAETMTEIDALQKQVKNAKSSDLDSVKNVTSELDGAKESLQKVAEEEKSLRSLVQSLKLELENVKEHSQLREREAETGSTAGILHAKLRKSKAELETVLGEEFKTRVATEEMISTLHQLSSDAENAQREAERMKHKAEELKMEAESTRVALDEAEKKLRAALEEAEEAKTAEARALDNIKMLLERTNAACVPASNSGVNIRISREEYESLSRKVEESESLAEMKVAAAMAQVEAVKASESEALKKLEAVQKEMEDTKVATQEALKRADMAEAAKRVVEGELRRQYEQEQKKVAETASRILAETEMSIESSPWQYRIQKRNPELKKSVEIRKLEKEKNYVSKKAILPYLSGVFQWKKTHIEGDCPY